MQLSRRINSTIFLEMISCTGTRNCWILIISMFCFLNNLNSFICSKSHPSNTLCQALAEQQQQHSSFTQCRKNSAHSFPWSNMRYYISTMKMKNLKTKPKELSLFYSLEPFSSYKLSSNSLSHYQSSQAIFLQF